MNAVSNTYAWQEAIELSKRVALMCEEFSDASTNVLVWHLREAIIEVPAGIATDLQAGRSATMTAAVKLATALELVRRIYPAIEGSEVEERLEQLMQRMQSDAFGERQPEPESAEPEAVSQPAVATDAPSHPGIITGGGGAVVVQSNTPAPTPIQVEEQ